VLYAEEGLDLADIARHVGHAAPATTAGYVRRLRRANGGRRSLHPDDPSDSRPTTDSERAASTLTSPNRAGCILHPGPNLAGLRWCDHVV
jgi:hypothetical protein